MEKPSGSTTKRLIYRICVIERRLCVKESVVITGAASGIGKSLVREFLKRGRHVAAIDLDHDGLESLTAESVMLSTTLLKTFIANVGVEKEIQDVVERIRETMGVPTLWVNSAGITDVRSFDEMGLDRFSQVLQVNLMGVVHGTRAAMSLMRDPVRGMIVNISSMSGVIPAPFLTSYTASKYAVCGFTWALREELRLLGSPLKIALVLPGFVRTPLIENNPRFSLPNWFSKFVADPETVAREIVQGIEKGQLDMTPSWNGKALHLLNRLAPALSLRSSRFLVAKDWKEALGLKPVSR